MIMSGTLPFFVAAGLALTGAQRWGRAETQSLLVLLPGIALLGYVAFGQGARPGAWRGDLLFVMAVMAWAMFTVLARRWALTPWQVVSMVGIWAGAAYLPVWVLMLPSHMAQVSGGVIAFQALVQGVLVPIVSVILFTRALILLGPARVSLVTALVPAIAGLLSMPLLGEELGLLDAAGLMFVSAAVALGVLRRPQSP